MRLRQKDGQKRVYERRLTRYKPQIKPYQLNKRCAAARRFAAEVPPADTSAPATSA